MTVKNSKLPFEVKLWGFSFGPFFSWLAARVLRNGIKQSRNQLLSDPAADTAEKEIISDGWTERPDYGFKPYVAVTPWDTGTRAVIARLFPRYGNYCGPNWSSGRESGSPVWDVPPIDWLDSCCYRHDMGYDTTDQAELLKADWEFLKGLEKPNVQLKGSSLTAFLYMTMCKIGLRFILIPYRMLLLNLPALRPLIFGWLRNVPKILPK